MATRLIVLTGHKADGTELREKVSNPSHGVEMILKGATNPLVISTDPPGPVA